MTKLSEDVFEGLNLAATPGVRTAIPGLKASEMLTEQRLYDSNVLVYPNQTPLALSRGLGATVEDDDGNVFIDFSRGVGALNVGHSNPEAVEAIKREAERITHGLGFPSEPRLGLSRRLILLAPGGLRGNSKVLPGGRPPKPT